MSLRLRDGISWCVCAGRAVFLDLEQDRFFSLSPDRDDLFRSWAEGTQFRATATLEPLCDSGLLIPDDGSRCAPAPAKLIQASRDLELEQGDKARLRDIAAAVLGQYRVSRMLRRLGLQATLARSRPTPRSLPESGAMAQARRLATAFAASNLLVRTADRCLPRAIAMRDLCHRAGLGVALVFGVRRDPFVAHCWVQLDDAILVGELEQVRLFTPILVVR